MVGEAYLKENAEIRIICDPVRASGPCVELQLERDIVFRIDKKNVLKLSENGDIHVKGNLISSDKQVVTALREWLEPIFNRENFKALNYRED